MVALAVATADAENNMGFKMKDKASLFGYNEKLSTFDTPVFEKNLEPGIEAEANRDGTIFISKNLSTPAKAAAVEHEKVHMEQMRQGRLSYDNNSVTWKPTTASPTKAYSRENMPEGASELPWEAEAYQKTKK